MSDLVLFEQPARPPTAREIVQAVCDEIGTPIPTAHKNIIGNHAKALLQDGFDPELIIAAGVTAVRRGAPQHMQFIASDFALAQTGQRMTRREYERALQDEQELRGGPR